MVNGSLLQQVGIDYTVLVVLFSFHTSTKYYNYNKQVY